MVARALREMHFAHAIFERNRRLLLTFARQIAQILDMFCNWLSNDQNNEEPNINVRAMSARFVQLFLLVYARNISSRKIITSLVIARKKQGCNLWCGSNLEKKANF